MGSGVTQTKHEIKDINVTRSLENGEILWRYQKNYQSRRRTSQFYYAINESWVTLLKNVHTPSAKSVLVPLGLTAVPSAVDAAIQKKIYGLGKTTLKISTKIVKSLEESGLLIKGISQTIKNEAKTQNGEFAGMLLGT